MIFNLSESKQPSKVRSLNMFILYYIPIWWCISFPVASLCVASPITGNFILAIQIALPLFMPTIIQRVSSVWDETRPEEDKIQGAVPGEVREIVGVAGAAPAAPVREPLTYEEMLDNIGYSALFERYDLDASGYIDSREELTQLTMAIIYKGQFDAAEAGALNLVANVELQINMAFEQASEKGVLWDKDEMKTWFIKQFLQK